MLFLAFLFGCWFGGFVYGVVAITLFKSNGIGGLSLSNLLVLVGWPVSVLYLAWQSRHSVIEMSVREDKK